MRLGRDQQRVFQHIFISEGQQSNHNCVVDQKVCGPFVRAVDLLVMKVEERALEQRQPTGQSACISTIKVSFSTKIVPLFSK